MSLGVQNAATPPTCEYRQKLIAQESFLGYKSVSWSQARWEGKDASLLKIPASSCHWPPEDDTTTPNDVPFWQVPNLQKTQGSILRSLVYGAFRLSNIRYATYFTINVCLFAMPIVIPNSHE